MTRSSIFLFFSLSLLYLPFTVAQSDFNMEKRLEKIDSLKTLLISASDQETARLYNELTAAYGNISYDSVSHYIHLAIPAAQKAGDVKSEALATKNLGLVFAGKNQYIKAIETQKQAFVLSESIEDYDLQVLCLNNIGYLCQTTFQLEMGLEHLFQGLKICEEQQLEDKYIRGLILGNIAACYSLLNDNEATLKYLNEVMEYAAATNSKTLRVRFCDELALALSRNDLDDEAKSTCEDCIKISNESGYSSARMNALMTMVEILVKQGLYKEALECTVQSEELGKKLGVTFMLPKILLQRSKILAKQNDIVGALQKAKEVYSQYESLRPKQVAELSVHLSKLYAQEKDFRNAHKFQLLYLEWSKKDNEQRVKYRAAELETKYQNKNQRKQIELLNKEKELKDKTDTLCQFGLGMLSLLLLIGGYSFFEKRKTVNQLALVNKELTSTQGELEKKHDDLEKYVASNIQLEQFAHVASHDLRAPIVTIKNFSELLNNQVRNKLNAEEQTYLGYIQTNANQTLELVTDLLEYSKINSQKINLQQIDLQVVVEDICSIFQQQVTENAISFRMKGNFPIIFADCVKLKRVFQNLISNAIKFSDSTRENKIILSCIEADKAWKFSVSDMGIGMKEHMVDIFQPYEQLHRKEEYQGSGLGLAICYRIIEQHGGTINYKTQLGVGSTFFFTIPK